MLNVNTLAVDVLDVVEKLIVAIFGVAITTRQRRDPRAMTRGHGPWEEDDDEH